MRVNQAIALTRLAFPAIFGLCLVACGPGFDPPSELHSLRVLAVQKDKPYAEPGETVNLQMLWEDASLSAGRPVTVAWSSPCIDPEGDLYYLCFADNGLFASSTPVLGDSTTITLPKDIISRRPPPSQTRNAPYGIAYVFFAACAGTLTPIPATSSTTFPIGCKDADGNLLGSDDFVAGYTAVYSFAGFSNNNPLISGFEVGGKTLAATQFCQGADCLAQAGSNTPADDIDCTGDDPRCIPSCAADGDSSCTGWSVHPVLEQDAKLLDADGKPVLVEGDPVLPNQDIDTVSSKLVGRHLGEQMWINYYTDQGSFKSPVRLLNDASAGWNNDYGTQFYAPKAPGLVRVWGVAHDNRGGVAWAGVTLKIQ
jgi:hypothetical protein